MSLDRRTARLTLATAAALVALLAAAATSLADSIVYTKGGDVWLTSPDGARQYQVTFDGGWDSPSQADDGTIVAAKGQMLTRMDRSGRVIGTPVPGLGGATSTIPGESFKLFGPFDPEVSPDGRQIAYWATAYNPSSTGDTVYTDWRDVVLVTPSDRFEMPRANWMTSVKSPSWLTNDRVAVTGSGLVNMSFETFVPGLGNDGLQWWFRNVNAMEGDWELSRDGRKVVTVAQTNGLSSPANTLHFFSVPGPAWTAPPYVDTWRDDAVRPEAGELRCENVRDSVVRNPSWSPSGDAIAYEDGDGIWIEQVPDVATTCDGMSERLAVPGGSHADWGPADVDMAQRPSGVAGPAPSAPAAPAPVAAQRALQRVKVPSRVRRGSPLRVAVTLRAPATVTASLCRARGRRCAGRRRSRTANAKAGTTRIALPTKRLRRGKYLVSVSVPGAPRATRTVRIR
ncbi:MAG TPA: hypothetical protein VF533_21185 [Solirubrobacteraceae bacterium]